MRFQHVVPSLFVLFSTFLGFATAAQAAQEYIVRAKNWKYVDVGQFNNGEPVQKSSYDIINQIYDKVTSQCVVEKSHNETDPSGTSVHIDLDSLLKVKLEERNGKNTFLITGFDAMGESVFKISGNCDDLKLGSLSHNLGLEIENETENLAKVNFNFDTYLYLNQAYANAKMNYPSCSCTNESTLTSDAFKKYNHGDHSEFMVNRALEFINYKKLGETLRAFSAAGQAKWDSYEIHKTNFQILDDIEKQLRTDNATLKLFDSKVRISFPYIDISTHSDLPAHPGNGGF